MSLRYILSFISALFTKFKGVILISIVSGVLVFLAGRYFIPIFFKENQKIGIVGRFRVDTLPNSILGLASEGLTNIAKNGAVTPGISSSYEIQNSGKTWVFHLDPKKTWQDGKKITSADINLTFSDVKVEKPDLQTIVFNLQNPFAPFPNVVSRPIFKKGLLGDGAWSVKGVTLSGTNVERIVFANKEGFRKTYNFYPTEERAKLALKLGEINILSEVFDSQPFDKWNTMAVHKNVDYGKYVAVFFNTSKDKITADKSLRQALSYAINKDVLGTPRAISPISPTSWAYNPQVKPYNYDTERAAELIKDLPNQTKNSLSLNLSTTPILLSKAEQIAKDWQKAGLKVGVQVTSGIPSDFDALLAIFDIPEDPDQYTLWHSSQEATNIANYSNPRIDKLLEDGRTEIDQEARKKIYLDFQRFLVEDSPAVFLYYPTTYTITKK